MKYKIFAAIILAAFAFGARGEVWTLEQCIEYAHAHDISVARQRLQVADGENSVTEAKDRLLPTVNANAGYNFDFGRGLTSENTYANRNTQNFAWNVGMQLPLFQGLRTYRQINYAKANLAALVEQVEAVKDNVTVNVMAQYLQVLYTGEVVKTAEAQLENARAELARRTTLSDEGKIAGVDVLQAQSQVAQDEMSLVQAQSDHRLALLSLAQLMQLPTPEGFEVAPLVMELPILPPAEEVYTTALNINHGVKASQLQIDAARRNISVAKAGYLPTLSFSAGLGSSFYRITGFDNPGFSQQMRDNFSKSLGFSLNIPIFDGLSTRNNVRRAKTALLNAELQRDEERLRLYHTIQQAHTQAQTSLARAKTAEQSLKIAEVTFDAITDKYNLGRATPTEYDQARLNLYTSKLTVIQARYEAMLRARILMFYATNRPGTGFETRP